MRPVWKAVCAAACLSTAPAHALPPDQIFERVAPAVWSVKAYTADEKLLASASGVVVAPGRVVTSCQVLARARLVQLRRGNTIFEAKLEYPDVERDLCQLEAPGLSAPAPTVGSARELRPGQRLYVVGFSRGNEQMIGEGLVSAVADAGSGRERIQTTVPASPGLMGAGVFDEEARLVGVVTSSPKDAASSAFAVPADWLAEVAARGQAALAARARGPAAAGAAASSVAAAPGLPVAGTAWVYGYTERIFSKKQIDVTVRVLRVDDTVVEEAVTANAPGAKDARRVVDVRESRFLEFQLTSSNAMVELAPYLLAVNGGKAPVDVPGPDGYPLGSPGTPGWQATVQVQGWEQVTVPAGTFRALRLEVVGRRIGYFSSRAAIAGRYKMVVWYAPEVTRHVRLEHRVWSANRIAETQIGEDVVELLSFRPPS